MFFKTLGLFLAIVFQFLGNPSFGEPAKAFAIDTDLVGPTSLYTPLLKKLPSIWRPPGISFEHVTQEAVDILCLDTPGNKFHIGAAQFMIVKAPFARVDAVVADIDGYQPIFPGYKKIEVLKKHRNILLTYWEQIIPVFFIPNVKYELSYIVDHSQPKLAFYRYQLKKGTDLKSADGIIVLEDHGDQTYYAEWDFGDAELGILKFIAPGKIWRDAISAFYLSDMALKLKSEHSDWDAKKIKKESEAVLKQYPIDKALEERKPFFMLNPSL